MADFWKPSGKLTLPKRYPQREMVREIDGGLILAPGVQVLPYLSQNLKKVQIIHLSAHPCVPRPFPPLPPPPKPYIPSPSPFPPTPQSQTP